MAGVNLCGFFEAETGLGQGVRTMAKALEQAGIPFVCNNVRVPWYANDVPWHLPFRDDRPHDVNIIHFNPDYLPRYLEERPDFLTGRYNVAFWNWELPMLPPAWVPWTRHFNEIWAPSTFTTTAIAQSTRTPVFLVPYPVTGDVPQEHAVALPGDAFKFLFAFDLHSSIDRKNPYATLEAYRRAFPEADGKRLLVVKLSHADQFEDEVARLAKACGGRRDVLLVRDLLTADALHGLMADADAYVALHRSEGFGFPIYESMAMGKPVVATAYSGNIDFMRPENSCLVNFELTPVVASRLYGLDTLWAEPDVEDAARHMRALSDDPAAARRLGERARDDMRRYLDFATAGLLLNRRVQAACRAWEASDRKALEPPKPPKVRTFTDRMTLRSVRKLELEQERMQTELVHGLEQMRTLHQRQQRIILALWRGQTPFDAQGRVKVEASALRPIELWERLRTLAQERAEVAVVLRQDLSTGLAEAASLDCRVAWPHAEETVRFMAAEAGFHIESTDGGLLLRVDMRQAV